MKYTGIGDLRENRVKEYRMTKNFRQFETEVGGRKVVVETGKYANRQNGSCIVRCGDTVVMVNVHHVRNAERGDGFLPSAGRL